MHAHTKKEGRGGEDNGREIKSCGREIDHLSGGESKGKTPTERVFSPFITLNREKLA